MDGGPRILIVGGGYGGMHTALRLERLLRPRPAGACAGRARGGGVLRCLAAAWAVRGIGGRAHRHQRTRAG